MTWSTISIQKKCSNTSRKGKNKNILMTTSGIDDEITVETAIKSVGIDNIMFGTDYPYEDFKHAVDFVKSLNISDEDKEKIFYKNAEKYILKK